MVKYIYIYIYKIKINNTKYAPLLYISVCSCSRLIILGTISNSYLILHISLIYAILKCVHSFHKVYLIIVYAFIK